MGFIHLDKISNIGFIILWKCEQKIEMVIQKESMGLIFTFFSLIFAFGSQLFDLKIPFELQAICCLDRCFGGSVRHQWHLELPIFSDSTLGQSTSRVGPLQLVGE